MATILDLFTPQDGDDSDLRRFGAQSGKVVDVSRDGKMVKVRLSGHDSQSDTDWISALQPSGAIGTASKDDLALVFNEDGNVNRCFALVYYDSKSTTPDKEVSTEELIKKVNFCLAAIERIATHTHATQTGGTATASPDISDLTQAGRAKKSDGSTPSSQGDVTATTSKFKVKG